MSDCIDIMGGYNLIVFHPLFVPGSESSQLRLHVLCLLWCTMQQSDLDLLPAMLNTLCFESNFVCTALVYLLDTSQQFMRSKPSQTAQEKLLIHLNRDLSLWRAVSQHFMRASSFWHWFALGCSLSISSVLCLTCEQTYCLPWIN